MQRELAKSTEYNELFESIDPTMLQAIQEVQEIAKKSYSYKPGLSRQEMQERARFQMEQMFLANLKSKYEAKKKTMTEKRMQEP